MIYALSWWWLLSFAAYRLTRLLVKDTFPPVLWLRDRLAGGWRPLTPAEWRAVRGFTPATQRVRLKPGPGQPDTGLQTQDIDGKTHRWVEKRPWAPDWLSELITCPWCASAYVSGAVVAVADLTHGIPVPWLMGFAVWAGAAILASREWL